MYKKIIRFINSKKFFYFILGLFVLESVWIALSAIYPMAFDEDFHFGIIKIYAHHLSPFLASQPPGADAFGAIARDPSYLYHYLMSFPYRLVSLFTTSLVAHVLVLRLIDIALFAWGLTLFRRVLLNAKASETWVNLALLFFVLVPVVPQLAGQVNYDNLFIPLTALALLWTMEFGEGLSNGKFDMSKLLKLVVLCLFASIVKYAFLPIVVAIALYLIYKLIWFRRTYKGRFKTIFKTAWQRLSLLNKIVSIVLILLGSVLFFQRYGINTLRYHMPIPNCNQVLSVGQCSAYGPWERDYLLQQSKGYVDPNPLRFTASWFYGLFERSLFAVNGPASNYLTEPYLPILALLAALTCIVGTLLFIFFSKTIVARHRWLGFLLLACLIYGVTLWEQDYNAYIKVGETVAINGRYIFPILPPILLAILLGYREFFKKFWTDRVLGLLIAAVLLVFITQGGGALTFIIRSDATWYWNNSLVDNANQWVRDIFNLFVMH